MTKAVSKRVPTPKPVVVEQVCSICDEDWAEHPEDATVMDCVEILKNKRGIKLSLADVCCGHGHNCCHSHHHWHYWYQQPYQITYTQPVWVNNTGGITTTIGISPSATNTTQLASLSNVLVS